MLYQAHMIIKHFHQHFTVNRIFNNLLFIFYHLLFFSPFYWWSKTETKISQSNSIIFILFCLFCSFVPHCTPNIVWFNCTNINLTHDENQKTNCSNFTSPIHIHLSLSFFFVFFLFVLNMLGKKTHHFVLFLSRALLFAVLIDQCTFFFFLSLLLIIDQHWCACLKRKKRNKRTYFCLIKIIEEFDSSWLSIEKNIQEVSRFS